MDQFAGHRKRVRHFDDPADAHELTFSRYKRLPLLVEPSRLTLLSRSIDAALERLEFQLAAFVYMPEHVHLLVFPVSAEARVSQILKAIKQPFSFRVKQLMDATGDPLRQALTVLERPGKKCFRFWQEGGGYDRNMTKTGTIRAAIDYLHLNPVRRGMVQRTVDWRWSSANYFACPDGPQDADLPTLHKLPWQVFTD